MTLTQPITDLLRLKALPLPKAETSTLKVDRETGHGVIRGVSLATSGPALGHGFELDEETIDQAAEHYEGKIGRWTHGDLSGDGLAQHLGRWKGLHTREIEIPDPVSGELKTHRQAVGDFHFTASAWKLKPDGLDVPAPEYLMDRAEEDPATLGISIVARFAMLEEQDADGTVTRRVGRILSANDAPRADWVADPAANPVGLHAGTGTMSEVIERAKPQLHKLAGRVGAEQARARILGFVDRELGTGNTHTSDEPQAAPAAEEAMDELKQAQEALAKAEQKLAAAEATIEAKDATIAELRTRENERVEAEREAYLASLNERALKGGADALSAEKVEQVRELMAVSEKGARALGEALLETALAQTKPTKAPTKLGDSSDPDDRTAKLASAIAGGKPLSEVEA